MMVKPVLILLLLLSTLLNGVDSSKQFANGGEIKFALPQEKEALFENGRQQYSQLMERRAMPVFGQCWARAVAKLEATCKQLDEHRQSWLAMTFTYCFLQTSGTVLALGDKCRELVVSDKYEDVSANAMGECTRSIDSSIFQTYTQFFIHTQSICFYLQAEQWQHNTEQLVDHLVVNARAVSNQLDSALNTTTNLERLQAASLKTQEAMHADMNEAKLNWQSFEEKTREQRDLLERLLEQFNLLRKFLLVELSTNSALVYYLLTMSIVYFVTSPTRALGARFVLYVLLLCSYLAESKAIEFIVTTGGWDTFGAVWLVRKFFMATMGLVYVWWVSTYQDYLKVTMAQLEENNTMLLAIDKKLSRLEESTGMF